MVGKNYLRPGIIYKEHRKLLNEKAKLTNAQVSKLCHEVVRALLDTAYQIIIPPWAELPSERKEIIINYVKFYSVFRESPRESHNNWLHSRVEDGWTYGLEYDTEDKRDPLIVEYSALPEIERLKDRAFELVIRSCWRLKC
jgi:hypothetical protein